MSSQRERWITIKNGNIVEHSENDGYTFISMNHTKIIVNESIFMNLLILNQ